MSRQHSSGIPVLQGREDVNPPQGVTLPPAPWHAHTCGCHHCHVWRQHRAKQMAAENEQATLDFGGGDSNG